MNGSTGSLDRVASDIDDEGTSQASQTTCTSPDIYPPSVPSTIELDLSRPVVTESKPRRANGSAAGGPRLCLRYYYRKIWSEYPDLPEDYLLNVAGEFSDLPMAHLFEVPSALQRHDTAHRLTRAEKGKLIVQITRDLVNRGYLDGRCPATVRFVDSKSFYLICTSISMLLALWRNPPRVESFALRLLKRGHPRGPVQIYWNEIVTSESVDSLVEEIRNPLPEETQNQHLPHGPPGRAKDKDLVAIVGVYYKLNNVCLDEVFSGEIYILRTSELSRGSLSFRGSDWRLCVIPETITLD